MQTDVDGNLLHQSDFDWLEDHGYEMPAPVVRLHEPRARGRSPASTSARSCRVACKRPKLDSIPEETPTTGGASASTDTFRTGEGAPGAGLLKALQNVVDLLDDPAQKGGTGRYDSRGFRSAVRRQVKKLCNAFHLRYPVWLDGEGLTIKQYRNRARWFIEDFMYQHTKKDSSDDPPESLSSQPPEDEEEDEETEEEGSSSSASLSSPRCVGPDDGLPGQGMPNGSSATAANDTTAPSPARIISHMMDNMMDDLDKLHPGVRKEVQQSMCSGGAEGPSGSGLPANGKPGASCHAPGTEAVDEQLGDPRQTQSEPPQSPRPLLDDSPTSPADEPQTHNGTMVEQANVSWPEQGPSEAAPVTAAEAPAESGNTTANGTWAVEGGGHESPLGSSWMEVDGASTVESFTLEDAPQDGQENVE